jgi:hypothetical protein
MSFVCVRRSRGEGGGGKKCSGSYERARMWPHAPSILIRSGIAIKWMESCVCVCGHSLTQNWANELFTVPFENADGPMMRTCD